MRNIGDLVGNGVFKTMVFPNRAWLICSTAILAVGRAGILPALAIGTPGETPGGPTGWKPVLRGETEAAATHRIAAALSRST